ncbi:unnamed protein product [Cladocopium goreaui]|uniref:RNase H type-1 domain-containing protein n=1 Tax=Cladocopium goreaui TaxID=2562237 RepID=A0A9P1BVR2_9DINO|nr:unnamed protein product [Cladocopium goreaui]
MIETWFVDHRWHNPHCRNSRQKQLFANYWQWEDELRRLWIDYVDARSSIDFYVVHPKPPRVANEVAAHVLLVQQEREDWVTSLVNVYEARPERPSLHYNIAVTTHEHILVDNILRVVGHETHCLAPIPSHGFVAWYLQLPLRRGQPLAGRSGYGISLQIWQFRLADYLPNAAASPVPQHGPILLQTKIRKNNICLEDALAEDSEESQKLDDVPSYAVRLRAGDFKSQVPAIVEIYGEPTEAKIVEELKNWGHDCFAFQFAGHHEFLCLARDRIPDDSLQHYIFGTSDGTDPNAAILHSHKGEVLQELDCMKILHSLGYFKTTIQAIHQCLPDVFKVIFAHQVSTLDPGSSKVRRPTPWPERISADLRQQPKPSFCQAELPVECGPCKLRLGVDLDTIATFFSNEEFPLCTTLEGLQIPPSTAMAPDFDWSTNCKVQDVERIVIYTDGSSLSHLRHQPPALTDEQGLPDTWAFVALGENYSEGELQCRIDHVAIPQSLRLACEFSIVDENFDLGLAHIDHELVGVQLHWQGLSQHRWQPRSSKKGFERADLRRSSLQAEMMHYQVPRWNQDIEQHVDHFNEFVITALDKQHPSRDHGPKKPYIDDEIWALRALKLRHRKNLRETQRRKKAELMFQAWSAWTQRIENQQHVDSVRCYTATLACCTVRCMAQLHSVAQQLRTRLCKAKATLLRSRLEQMPRDASAGQILQAIHKLQGPTNPKKIKKKPFPLLKKSDGTHCESSSQRCDRWAEFFCNMEGGRRMTHQDLREGWIDNLQHFQQQEFDLSLKMFPTLCDLERAYSHVRLGRAVGSRPGDCFADTIFGYLWARVLRSLEQKCIELGLLEVFPEQEFADPFAVQGHDGPDAPQRPFLGPCWMDDLAIPIAGNSAEEAVRKVGLLAGLLLDQCVNFAMSPNLAAGKTELLLALRGCKSRQLRQQFYGAHGRRLFPIVGEHSSYQIQVVTRYKHLGGIIHHGGDQRQEAKQRLAVAHQTFTQQRTVLYCNPTLAQQTRTQMFESIVCSALTYGSESWCFCTVADRHHIHVGIIKLCKRLIKWVPQKHNGWNDDEICDFLGLPTPTELLRRA